MLYDLRHVLVDSCYRGTDDCGSPSFLINHHHLSSNAMPAFRKPKNAFRKPKNASKKQKTARHLPLGSTSDIQGHVFVGFSDGGVQPLTSNLANTAGPSVATASAGTSSSSAVAPDANPPPLLIPATHLLTPSDWMTAVEEPLREACQSLVNATRQLQHEHGIAHLQEVLYSNRCGKIQKYTVVIARRLFVCPLDLRPPVVPSAEALSALIRVYVRLYES